LIFNALITHFFYKLRVLTRRK